MDAYGNVRGHFEYDAFGNTVAMWGDLAHTFRFRFSTKYWDDETRSYYYGYRHYAPKLGCWLSRDPIGEIGGEKLYGFAYNNPQNLFDPLGQDASSLPPLGGANNNRIVLDEARVTCRICELGKLCIRVNSPKAPLLDQLNQLATSKGLKGGHDSGHTFLLGVLRSQGGKESREGIGFWPDLSIAWSFFGGHRGDIRDDSKEHWSHQICFSMCPATWEKIKKNKQGQAPIYNVFVTQCSTWALVTTLDVGYRHGFRMMRPVTPEEIKKYDRARLFLTKKFFELTSILPISISQKATEPYELARMPGFSPQ